MGRFHAWYNQELTKPEGQTDNVGLGGDVENEWSTFGGFPNNPTDENNYLFCETEGEGHFVGVNYYVNCPSPMWYGEGDDMFLVDGEPWPGSAHGTGTEVLLQPELVPGRALLSSVFRNRPHPRSSERLGKIRLDRPNPCLPLPFRRPDPL